MRRSGDLRARRPRLDPVQDRLPDPAPAAGEALVRVRACTLNYHDIFTRRGMPGIKVPMPAIMGLDFAGEIVALGAGVSDWKARRARDDRPVDRVGPGGLVGEVRPGGLAELCARADAPLVRLPAEVSFEDAACCPWPTAPRSA